MNQPIDSRAQHFHYLSVARHAAREAGEILKSMLLTAEVHEKSTKDLVTDADVAAQKSIQSILSSEFPSHEFVGEEEDAAKDIAKMNGSRCWVVDPIDGTANYVHRLNNFAVSIALVESNIPLVGVVYDPMANEMFTAVNGYGAMMNDRRISASGCKSLGKSLIAASFPPNVQHGDSEISQFVNVLVAAQSVRRLGSAALNLCYVACGRLDGYWANRVRPWDIAAGVLIAQEAGAFLTARNGSVFDLSQDNFTIGATPALHQELLSALQSDKS